MSHYLTKRAAIAAFTAASVLSFTSVTFGEIRYVDDDAPLFGDGLTWETPYRFLQDALFEADGDPGITEIRVGGGTYKPDQDEGGNVTPGDQEATFQLISGVALMGAYAGFGAPDPDDRIIETYVTTLSGDIGVMNDPSDNNFHVVTSSNTNATTVLDGFTITAGRAWDETGSDVCGGGMYNDSGSPHVVNCTFRDNRADRRGGGMYSMSNGRPQVTACTFEDNFAYESGGGIHAEEGGSLVVMSSTFVGNVANWIGGGIASSRCDLTVIDCSFTNNDAAEGGGIRNFETTSLISNCLFALNIADGGGGVSVAGADQTTIVSCVFVDNWTFTAAGALYTGSGSISHVLKCVFTTNVSVNFGGAVDNGGTMTLTGCAFNGNDAPDGGGLYNGGTATISGCIFEDNGGALFNTGTATISGSSFEDNGIYVHSGNATARNCTFGGMEGGAIASETGTTTTVTNCVLWSNTPDQISGDGEATVSYSCIEGGFPGECNIDADPMFVDPSNGDYHLSPGSPCIDQGNNDAATGITTDRDGDPRFLDDANTADCLCGNCGTAPIVDMGSDEHRLGLSETLCPEFPNDFHRQFGGPVTGDALDLCAADDVRLEVLQSARLSPLLPFIQLEYWARSTFVGNTIVFVEYTIEGHVSANVSGGQNPDTLRTSILNYSTGLFEMVDQRGTGANADETINHVQTTNAPDYVNAGDGEVRVRQDVFDPGNVFTPNWFLKVDLYEVKVGK